MKNIISTILLSCLLFSVSCSSSIDKEVEKTNKTQAGSNRIQSTRDSTQKALDELE